MKDFDCVRRPVFIGEHFQDSGGPLVLSSVAMFAGNCSDQSVQVFLKALHSRVGGVHGPGRRDGEFVDRFVSTDLALNEAVGKGL
jgi:hypothetical protein